MKDRDKCIIVSNILVTFTILCNLGHLFQLINISGVVAIIIIINGRYCGVWPGKVCRLATFFFNAIDLLN